MALKVKNF